MSQKDASEFISENMKLSSELDGKYGKSYIFNINQAQFAKYLKSRGLDKTTMTAYYEAQNDYANGAAEVVQNELLKHDDSYCVTVRSSTPIERIDLGVFRKRIHNNPKGEGKITKYGKFFRDTKTKSFDLELLTSFQDAIQKATEGK